MAELRHIIFTSNHAVIIYKNYKLEEIKLNEITEIKEEILEESKGKSKIELKGIKIGKYFIEKPIVQGGMGVGISWDQLAGNVAKNGCLGTISAICTGYYQNSEICEKSCKWSSSWDRKCLQP